MPKGIHRKNHTSRFNQIHQDLEKNRKGNASRTAWANTKKRTTPKKTAGDLVKARKLAAKEVKRKKYFSTHQLPPSPLK